MYIQFRVKMADQKNPFELDNVNAEGPDKKFLSKVWTAEEQTEKLNGYIEVSPEYWEQIKYGTHIRYYSKSQGFRPGGFVSKNPYDVVPKNGVNKKRFMKLQNGFNPQARGYQTWILAYEDADKVFIKPDASVMVMMQSLEGVVHGLNENIRKLAEHAKKMEARIASLERG